MTYTIKRKWYKKARFYISFDKRLPFKDRTIVNPLMKIYQKITSAKTDRNKLFSMKHIVQPLPSRTESHKINGKDRIKSSSKTVQFAYDCPSTSSMMKPKVVTCSTTWTPKIGLFIQHSQSTFISEQKHMENI